MATKRAAIYARRSMVDAERDRSIAEQREACERWCRERGYEVARVYEELGSGVRGDTRPEFSRMVADAARKPRPYDIIVTLDVSRFSRGDEIEAAHYLWCLREAGVEVAYVIDGEALAGPAGEYVRPIMQAAAHDHSKKTSYKVALAKASQVQRGTWLGGTAPLGYRAIRKDGWDGRGRCDARLVVHESEAAVVRRMASLYLSGVGYVAVARALDAEGVPTREGGPWHASTVEWVLRNPVYAGVLSCGRRDRGRAKFYRVGEGGPVAVGSPTAGVAREDAVPAILDAETWARLQAERARRSRPAARTGGTPALLSGLPCGGCGGSLGVSGTTVKGRRYGYYGCRRCRRHVHAARLDAAVLDAVRAEIATLDPERLAAALRRARPEQAAADDARALGDERRRLVARRERLLLDATRDDALVFRDARALADRVAALDAEIAARKAAGASVADYAARITAAVERVRRLDAPDTAEGQAALRAAVRGFVARLEIGHGRRGQPKPVSLTVYTPRGLAAAFPGTVQPTWAGQGVPGNGLVRVLRLAV